MASDVKGGGKNSKKTYFLSHSTTFIGQMSIRMIKSEHFNLVRYKNYTFEGQTINFEFSLPTLLDTCAIYFLSFGDFKLEHSIIHSITFLLKKFFLSFRY